MNDKLCKRLRKTAREMTIGMPDRQLVELPTRYNNRVRLENAKKTFRGVYRFLKATIGNNK